MARTTIPVPADRVRSRGEILSDAVIAKATDGREYVWTLCSNCGGSGSYPSSMSPPGKCRLYCWKGRTPATFGRMPVDIDKYVKRQQAADRRAYRNEVVAEKAERERVAKLPEQDARRAEPDERIAAVLAAVNRTIDECELRETNRCAPEPDWNVEAPDYIDSIVYQWLRTGKLSEKQWAALARRVESEHERDAKRARLDAFVTGEARCPNGRLSDVELLVLSTKDREGHYGMEYKMLCRSRDGWKLWVSRPSSVEGLEGRDPLERGHVIVMNVAVERSRDDAMFGFGKRPAKARLVGKVAP